MSADRGFMASISASSASSSPAVDASVGPVLGVEALCARAGALFSDSVGRARGVMQSCLRIVPFQREFVGIGGNT